MTEAILFACAVASLLTPIYVYLRWWRPTRSEREQWANLAAEHRIRARQSDLKRQLERERERTAELKRRIEEAQEAV